MIKAFRIVTEYEHTSPFIGCATYPTVEAACENVDPAIGKRTWICPVTVLESGEIHADHFASEHLVAENGLGVGPLAP